MASWITFAGLLGMCASAYGFAMADRTRRIFRKIQDDVNLPFFKRVQAREKWKNAISAMFVGTLIFTVCLMFMSIGILLLAD